MKFQSDVDLTTACVNVNSLLLTFLSLSNNNVNLEVVIRYFTCKSVIFVVCLFWPPNENVQNYFSIFHRCHILDEKIVYTYSKKSVVIVTYFNSHIIS